MYIQNVFRISQDYLQITLVVLSKPLKFMLHEKYAEAYKLYCNTELSGKEIARQCKVSVSGFRRYIQVYHRDTMYKRYHINASDLKSEHFKNSGNQGYIAHKKYQQAILKCKDLQFIELSISAIARKYNLNPDGLWNQLRSHFPDILEWREKEQTIRGISTYRQVSHMKESTKNYQKAVQLLKENDMTIKEAAEKMHLSFTGLRQHLLFYHKDLVKSRQKKRKSHIGQKHLGKRSGNNTIHMPSEETICKYAAALQLYQTTSLTIKAICQSTDVPCGGFCYYLQTWHRDLMLKRKGIKGIKDPTKIDLTACRHYLPSTAEKYAEPIQFLQKNDMNISAVARKYNVNPESFRMYLKEHNPEILSRFGMIKTSDGRLMSRRSFEKYRAAIETCRNSKESLKKIAEDHNLAYNSFSKFLQRNYPELIQGRK